MEKFTNKINNQNIEVSKEKLLDVIKVKYFPNAYKEYTFLSDGITCNVGDRVLVYTNGQKQEVIVSKPNFKTSPNEYNFALKSIIRKI